VVAPAVAEYLCEVFHAAHISLVPGACCSLANDAGLASLANLQESENVKCAFYQEVPLQTDPGQIMRPVTTGRIAFA